MKRKGYIKYLPEFLAQPGIQRILATMFPEGYTKQQDGEFIKCIGESQMFDEIPDSDEAPQYAFKMEIIEGQSIITDLVRKNG